MNTVEQQFSDINYPPTIMDEDMKFQYLAGPDLNTPILGADGFETIEFEEDGSPIGIREGRRYSINKTTGKIDYEIIDKPTALAA